jgi:hypothetical protein
MHTVYEQNDEFAVFDDNLSVRPTSCSSLLGHTAGSLGPFEVPVVIRVHCCPVVFHQPLQNAPQ